MRRGCGEEEGMSFLPRRKSSDEMNGLAGLQKEMNSLFERFFGRESFPSFFGGQSFAPVLDMVETKEAVEVRAELPGISKDDLDITVTGDMLTIKGEKKSGREEKESNYHLVERSYGLFQRSVSIPSYVDTEKVSAQFKDGVLTVRLAKKEEVKGKSVKVDVK